MPRRVNGFSFREALDLAMNTAEPMGMGGDPGPLADYVASVPLTAKEMRDLAAFSSDAAHVVAARLSR
jgi:hypothetical protein